MTGARISRPLSCTVSKGNPGNMEARSRRIASIGKAFAALSAVANSQEPVSAKSLSTIMGTPLPTTYHLLNTLVAEGALVKGDDRAFRLGPRVGMLGDAYLEQGEPTAGLQGPLRRLASTTGETAYLSVWRHGDIEVVATAEGSHAVRVAQLQRGSYGHAHARASGKLLLAYARPGLREQYLREHAFDARTENTITDVAELNADFERIRLRGYSTDLEEFAQDVSCVAAPIIVAERIIGAYTVSSPTSRFDDEIDNLVKAVLAACHEAADIMTGATSEDD